MKKKKTNKQPNKQTNKKQNTPSTKTFEIKQLENQDCDSQHMKSRNPLDAWKWLSTKENMKHHGRCSAAKKGALMSMVPFCKRDQPTSFLCFAGGWLMY